MKRQTKLVARGRFVLPVEPAGDTPFRIDDGYILTEGSRISEVGAWNAGVAARIEPLVQQGEIVVLGSDVAPGAGERAGSPVGSTAGATEDTGIVPRLPGILLPGFVKAHGHDHESLIIGVAKDEPLADWLDHAVNAFASFVEQKMPELEKVLSRSPYLVSYLKARLDDLSYGITSTLVHHCNYNKYHLGEIVEANRLAGTRMFLAVGSQDRHYDPRILDRVDEAVARLDAAQAAFASEERLTILPGPDQLFSNGPELLRALKAWAAERGSLVHIHSSEEPRTTRWFRETYGQTPVEYADSIGFLDERTMLAHQVNSTERDLEIIRDTGAMVVHNPLANTILGSGMPPLLEMMAMGIPVAVSTDGSGSADNQNIIAAARLAAQFQKAFHRDASVLPSETLLRLVTREPARMLGLQAGALRPGWKADFILVDLRGANLNPTRLDNCLENLFWAANGSEIRFVVAGGRVLVDDYRNVALDGPGILDQVCELSERFQAWRPEAEEIRATGARHAKGDEEGADR